MLELEKQVLKIIREKHIPLKDVFSYQTYDDFVKNNKSVSKDEWVLLNKWASL